jgi:hypothetical protein
MAFTAAGAAVVRASSELARAADAIAVRIGDATSPPATSPDRAWPTC